MANNETLSAKSAQGNEQKPAENSVNFEGIEAFNLLRTNLSLSFADRKTCHIIGITSPTPGAGKSMVSVNLSRSFSKTNSKVLLIDGDMRLPTIAKKMKLQPKPGLSNALVSGIDINTVVQHLNPCLDVLAAGDIPPNPSELLGSEEMNKLLTALSKSYNYIFLDLPPVGAVSDALVVSRFLDGLVLVVCKDHDDKRILNETMRQLELSKAKVLGFVFNNGREDLEKKKRSIFYRMK